MTVFYYNYVGFTRAPKIFLKSGLMRHACSVGAQGQSRSQKAQLSKSGGIGLSITQ
jgi:hypothetical protein